jgi:hypothetical protein
MRIVFLMVQMLDGSRARQCLYAADARGDAALLRDPQEVEEPVGAARERYAAGGAELAARFLVNGGF